MVISGMVLVPPRLPKADRVNCRDYDKKWPPLPAFQSIINPARLKIQGPSNPHSVALPGFPVTIYSTKVGVATPEAQNRTEVAP
jgi:hypothetical protein